MNRDKEKIDIMRRVASDDNDFILDVLRSVKPRPQTQIANDIQIRALYLVANRLGLYDAADTIRSRFNLYRD